MSIKRGNFHIIDQIKIFSVQREDYKPESGQDFWENANKYSWSNGEYEFLKEMSFIMVNLHHQSNSDE